jgi:hypothetical protein
LTALSEAIDKHGVEPSAEIKEKFAGFGKWSSDKVVHVDHWRERAYRAMTVDAVSGENKTDTKKKAFQRCRNRLFDSGHVVLYGDFAWCIFD